MAQTDRLVSTPYCGPVPSIDGWWLQWNGDPVLLVSLGLVLAWGWRAAQDRRAFLTAWGLMVLAFVSPLCALTTVSLAARSLHHLLLFTLIAPLLALSVPWRALSVSTSAALTAGAMLAWHMPQVYALAWQSPLVYWTLQAALLAGSWALWSGVLRPRASGAEGLALQVMALMGLAGVMGLIGAILTFAPRPLYDAHLAGAMAWGFAPLADQQMAGLIMWVPGMLPLALIAGQLMRKFWRLGQVL